MRQPATGTIAEDWLTGLGFDKQALEAVEPDICSLRMVDSLVGRAIQRSLAPVTASDGSHDRSPSAVARPRMSGAAKGEPRNKRGKASWLKDGLIRLGNHGEGCAQRHST